jgi:hypothetical protein
MTTGRGETADRVFRVEEVRERRGKKGGWSRWVAVVEVRKGSPPPAEPSYGEFEDHGDACRHASMVQSQNAKYKARKDQPVKTYFMDKADQAREEDRLRKMALQRLESERRGTTMPPGPRGPFRNPWTY